MKYQIKDGDFRAFLLDGLLDPSRIAAQFKQRLSRAGRLGLRSRSHVAGKEDRMAKHLIEIRSMRRLGERCPDTALLAASNACANCALRHGPACADCIDHALKGHGLVHRIPIVRH
jgi:hypothetical protein